MNPKKEVLLAILVALFAVIAGMFTVAVGEVLARSSIWVVVFFIIISGGCLFVCTFRIINYIEQPVKTKKGKKKK